MYNALTSVLWTSTTHQSHDDWYIVKKVDLSGVDDMEDGAGEAKLAATLSFACV
jgi:hypothetical protein